MVVIQEAVQRAVAGGYLLAKGAIAKKAHRLRFEGSLQKMLDRAPGYDKTLVPKRRRK